MFFRIFEELAGLIASQNTSLGRIKVRRSLDAQRSATIGKFRFSTRTYGNDIKNTLEYPCISTVHVITRDTS